MTTITHPELVSALCKPGEAIASDLNHEPRNKALLLLEAVKAVKQVGELEKAKKQVVYNKPLGLEVTHTETIAICDLLHVTPISAKEADLLHMSIGILGEAGELLESVINYIITGDEFDRDNAVEELGDLAFFIEGFQQNRGITREEAISQNISKLSKRYQSLSYSDKAAQERADKAEA